ncbi:MAG: Lrp/AsnC family transcriptional regulator [Dermatophilaceae bacterium]
MDAIDHRILRELQQDGRVSNVDLAERVGLSPSPCLRRVRALEETGVISGYRAVLDPTAVGRGFEVVVSATLRQAETSAIAAFERAVSALDDVVEVRRMMGTPDYLIRVVVADLTAYELLYSQHLMALPGVERVSSQIAMKLVKPDAGVPVPRR